MESKDKTRIGIGITARNRPEILRYCLTYICEYTNKNTYDIFIVVNDDSNNDKKKDVKNVVSDFNYVFPNIEYRTNTERLGIAKSKNVCLRYMVENKCDYMFLFDEDCFPKRIGWIELFINAHKCSKSEHLIFLRELGEIRLKRTFNNCVEEYDNCGGCLLFFTKKAIDTIGGYDENFGIYGYEHAEITNRAKRAGLIGFGMTYASPTNAKDYIYSFDFDLNHFGQMPPYIGLDDKINFKSSIDGENVNQYVEEAAKIFMDRDVNRITYGIKYPHSTFNYNKYLNIALKHCKSDYVIISNNDVIFDKGFFSECTKNMELYNLDSCSCYCPDWTPHVGLKDKITFGWNIGREFCGWNLIYRRESIKALLPLAEEFTFFCQDNHMAIEGERLGMRHALIGTATVKHLISKSHWLIKDNDYFQGNVDRFHKRYGR
jgi:GT2 family glycosyltransferase